MKITYLQLPDGDKLISYHQHDFKSKEIDGELYYIDGGQKSGYIRVGGNPDKCKTVTVELEEIFDFIRKDVTFGLNPYLDKASVKSISSSLIHIKHLETDKDLKDSLVYNMSLLELKHRNESKGNKEK